MLTYEPNPDRLRQMVEVGIFSSFQGHAWNGNICHSWTVHLVWAKRAATDYLSETMTVRANFGWGLLGGLALAMSGCVTPPAPVQPPPVVATLSPPPPPMPAGGYIGMNSPTQRADGTYFTPNLDNTDQAAVWHLRNALNVAALGCDQAGGGVVEAYNAWIRTHAAVIDRYYQAYIQEWQAPGWWDWQRVYDDNQTRIYNFYAQPAMRAAFCAVARVEVAQVGQVADADLPAFARAALLRLDRPFVEFYAAFDAWRDYYQPAPPPVVPPTLVRTIDVPIVVTPPAAVATLDANDQVAAATETWFAPAPDDALVPSNPSPQ
ncbi:hypothetical protein [Sphingomonas sp.]|uniref:hypothetical protein n=1 Tax=Sphingomonas sp. TaxID=28214 RepID=UPI0035C7BCB0